MTRCAVCRQPLAQNFGESPANFRRRVTCGAQACVRQHRAGLTRQSQARARARTAGEEKPPRRFYGSESEALFNFLRGKSDG